MLRLWKLADQGNVCIQDWSMRQHGLFPFPLFGHGIKNGEPVARIGVFAERERDLAESRMKVDL
jgi:hypothetical protein